MHLRFINHAWNSIWQINWNLKVSIGLISSVQLSLQPKTFIGDQMLILIEPKEFIFLIHI